jgi:multiple sugar transport system substrate-binding protein
LISAFQRFSFVPARFASGLVASLGTAFSLLVLALALFPACRPAEDGAVRLVLMTAGGPVGEGARQAVERFERDHPGVTVQMISAPGADYYVKGLTMLAGRAHLDVLWMGQGFGMFASRNALLDLTPFIEADPDFDEEDYFGLVLDWYRFGGKTYGIPYGIDVQTIAYNQDLFDHAGLPYPTGDWTIDDMVEIGRKLTLDLTGDGRINQYGLGMTDLRPTYFGLDLLTPDHRHFGLNNDAGRQWLAYNLHLSSERVLRQSGDEEAIDRLNEFLNQRVAIIDFYTWDIHHMRGQANFRWDIVPVPISRTGERVAWASSSGYCIAGHTRHPDLSWKLLRYLVDDEMQRHVVRQTVPASPRLHTTYLDTNPPPPENLRAVLDSLPDLRPFPRIAAQREVYSDWQYWTQMANQGRLSVEETLARAEESIDRILAVHRTREDRQRHEP